MTGLPTVCASCGYEWIDSQMIRIEGSTNLTIEDTGGASCPRCHVGIGMIRDGHYEFANGVLTAFRALTRTQLVDLQDVLEQSRSGAVEPEVATQQAAEISPEMAALLVKLNRTWTAPVILQLLLAVLAIVIPLATTDTLSDGDHMRLQQDLQTAIQNVLPPAEGPEAVADGVRPHPQKGKPRRKKPPKTNGKRKKTKKRR